MDKIRIVFLTVLLSGCISFTSSYDNYVSIINGEIGVDIKNVPRHWSEQEKTSGFVGIQNLPNGNIAIGYLIARKTCPTWFEYDPGTEIIVRWWTTAKNPKKDCGINA